jgi:hypothetical protein
MSWPGGGRKAGKVPCQGSLARKSWLYVSCSFVQYMHQRLERKGQWGFAPPFWDHHPPFGELSSAPSVHAGCLGLGCKRREKIKKRNENCCSLDLECPPKAHVLDLVPSLVLLVCGAFKRWSLVRGFQVMGVCLRRGYWDTGPFSSFLFHVLTMWLCFAKHPCHDVLPCHKPESNGPTDCGLQLPKL